MKNKIASFLGMFMVLAFVGQTYSSAYALSKPVSHDFGYSYAHVSLSGSMGFNYQTVWRDNFYGNELCYSYNAVSPWGPYNGSHDGYNFFNTNGGVSGTFWCNVSFKNNNTGQIVTVYPRINVDAFGNVGYQY